MTPEEAKREVEWWDRNRPAVEAFANGKRVQARTSDSTWETVTSPKFSRSYDWRPAPEPTLRPYTDEELRGMVGKVFVEKPNGDTAIADHCMSGRLHISGEGYYDGTYLMQQFTNIDGSPCGVME